MGNKCLQGNTLPNEAILERPDPTGKSYIDIPVQNGQGVLGYWEIRGLAHPIRCLLTHLRVPFAEKRYKAKGTPTNFDLSEWFNDKFSLGLQFPNLPFYIDGDVKLTESQAIHTYICRKYKIEYLGRNSVETAKVMLMANILAGFKQAYNGTVYNPAFEQKKAELNETYEKTFGQIADFMGNKPFTCSSSGPTWVDFQVQEDLIALEKMRLPANETILPRFRKFRENMLRLNGVADFLRDNALPFNNLMAAFKQAVS